MQLEGCEYAIAPVRWWGLHGVLECVSKIEIVLNQRQNMGDKNALFALVTNLGGMVRNWRRDDSVQSEWGSTQYCVGGRMEDALNPVLVRIYLILRDGMPA